MSVASEAEEDVAAIDGTLDDQQLLYRIRVEHSLTLGQKQRGLLKP